MSHKIITAGMVSLLLLLFSASSALAHGSEPRLEISVERVNPGGVVDVRGVGFEPEEAITLSLVGDSVEIQLGELAADSEGGFTQIITLPGDLAGGSYNFRAATDDHEIFSPVLMVQGPAILNEENSEAREEDDTLLAPMPTFSPATTATPNPAKTSALTPTAIPAAPIVTKQQTGTPVSALAATTTLFFILGSVLMIWRRAQKR